MKLGPPANLISVLILYVTIWFDENDNVVFKKDIYDRDQPVLEGLNEEFTIWQTRAFK
jgi:murein L,D-transpeptidase YcbB/YkuD